MPLFMLELKIHITVELNFGTTVGLRNNITNVWFCISTASTPRQNGGKITNDQFKCDPWTKICLFRFIFIKPVPYGAVDEKSSLVYLNDLVQNGWQAIIWTNDDPIQLFVNRRKLVNSRWKNTSSDSYSITHAFIKCKRLGSSGGTIIRCIDSIPISWLPIRLSPILTRDSAIIDFTLAIIDSQMKIIENREFQPSAPKRER